MKEYCVDLEIAKELDANRFPHRTYLRYQIDTLGKVELETVDFAPHDHVEIVYDAPVVEDILKALPLHFEKDEEFYWLNVSREGYSIDSKESYYEISYHNYENKCLDAIVIEDDKLSNALAKMWLYLKKEGYIK